MDGLIQIKELMHKPGLTGIEKKAIAFLIPVKRELN